MQLNELFEEAEVQYHARITFVSRMNTRKMQYSTRRVKEALADAGYETYGAVDNLSERQPLQSIDINGTREEVLKQREDIERVLRIAAGGRVSKRFEVISKS